MGKTKRNLYLGAYEEQYSNYYQSARERERACMLLFIKTDIYFMHRECKMIAGDIVGALL